MSDFDYVLVGGGLQNGLIALALRHHQPTATVALVERGDRLGGNHTWCLHEQDMPGSARAWMAPLVTYRWSGYQIHFPQVSHTLDDAYVGVSSERFGTVIAEAIAGHEGSSLRLDAEVTKVAPDSVTLTSGEKIYGAVVIDARGLTREEATGRSGYQKFFGMEIELESPHGLDLPVIMDARLEQTEGFRFMYVLPLDDRRLLLEDTYFHDSPKLDVARLESAIRDYAEASGWLIERVVRTEQGVLPMPWTDRIEPPGRSPLVAGYRGGWFHPGTGYSFPVALRLAEFVAGRPAHRVFGRELNDLARRHRGQARYARFLNRLLFRWYPPASRRYIFERVYRLPMRSVRNFYALRLRWLDRARFLLGRPPRGLSLRHRLTRPLE